MKERSWLQDDLRFGLKNEMHSHSNILCSTARWALHVKGSFRVVQSHVDRANEGHLRQVKQRSGHAANRKSSVELLQTVSSLCLHVALLLAEVSIACSAQRDA